jgi:hypothetical protein
MKRLVRRLLVEMVIGGIGVAFMSINLVWVPPGTMQTIMVLASLVFVCMVFGG